MFPRFASPKTLSKAEQRHLLRAVRAHGSPRDRALHWPLARASGSGSSRASTRGIRPSAPNEVSAELFPECICGRVF